MEGYNDLLPKYLQKRRYKFITKSLAEVVIQNFLGDEWLVVPNSDEEIFSVWAFNRATNKPITFVYENDFEIYILKKGKEMEYNREINEFAQKFMATKVYAGTSIQDKYINALLSHECTNDQDALRIISYKKNNDDEEI